MRAARSRDDSVRCTSMRSKHSIWSPGLTSLYAFTPMPHFGAADFVHVLLEAAQRFQFALEDDGVVAQHADRLAALDHALDDHAAGDGAELRAAEHVADLGGADDLLADFLAQQTFEATCFTWSMTS